ncbi:pilus assembly protein TadB [Herminiimonas sp. KBW02]|uniref:type II secretion system F family protein n=1 Tax=Herminiimonas sp. KBW02 TaxID=2153363 RepID=UPI000F5B4721|nr:type II secretion system F family protein [Herminiimonas sp. KBW02]RQO34664.1 pilus assembly protein TadB [Herminiimonas sp. KBW02]
MPVFALWMIAVAILLLAGGIVLWHNAQLHQQQDATSAFVDHQIRSMEQSQAITAEDIEQQAGLQFRIESNVWRKFLLRAGVVETPLFYAILVGPGILFTLLAAYFGGVLSVIGTIFLYVTLSYFRLWMKAVRRHQKMVRQLPAFLDTMVRLTIVGNSLESAFQATVLTTEAPLRELLDRSNRLVQAGMDLEHALLQKARVFQVLELELIAAVIGVALRFGGRADMVLERMAAFMRDREYAQNELVALSAETRLSGWVLGLLPIGLGVFMVIFNNQMFVTMLEDPIGKNLLIFAATLEVLGAYWLYRLAKSV